MNALATPVVCRECLDLIFSARQRRYAKGETLCRPCFRVKYRGARPTAASLEAAHRNGSPKPTEAPTSTFRLHLGRAAAWMRSLGRGGGK